MKNISLPLSFKSNKYYFLVSIEDEKAIRAVYDDIVVRRCDLNNLQCEYISFNYGSELVSIVSKIEKETIEQGTYPHVHIETHGCEEGIQLSNSFILDWDFMANQLQKINGACGNNLVVTMAACDGGFFSLSLYDNMIKSRAQSLIIIGPSYKSNFGELESGFSNFFDTFLNSSNLNEAIVSLKQELKGSLEILSCQLAFCQTIQKKIDLNFKSQTTFNDHYETTQAKLIIRRKLKNISQRKILRKETLWNDCYRSFQELRRIYFWIDKFPENESRFVKIDMAEEYPY